jgi:hypothetical protein
MSYKHGRVRGIPPDPAFFLFLLFFFALDRGTVKKRRPLTPSKALCAWHFFYNNYLPGTLPRNRCWGGEFLNHAPLALTGNENDIQSSCIQHRRCRMIRTQIYLTERQRDELAAISKTAGKKQSELIRDAVNRLIDQSGRSRREVVLREAAGIWKNRKDLPDFKATRAEWDRN